MSRFKEFKQKVKENKGKIIIGTIAVAGVILYVVLNEKEKMEMREDIDLLTDVMDGTVLSGLRASHVNKLRYAEGRLTNGLKSGTMSEVDQQLRKEEINFYSNEIVKVDRAKELIHRKRG